MTRPLKPNADVRITRLCIWSIRNQTWLAGQVRIYIFMATGIIAFLALAGVISLQTAMFSSIGIGLVAMGIIWTLVQQRKAWLLNLKDPEVRRKALAAMHDYIDEVQAFGKAPLAQKRSEHCVDCHL